LAWRKVWTLLELYRELEQHKHLQDHQPFLDHNHVQNSPKPPPTASKCGQIKESTQPWLSVPVAPNGRTICLAEYLEGLFEQPVVVYPAFAVVVLPAAIMLEWVAAERDVFAAGARMMGLLALRIDRFDCKSLVASWLIWNQFEYCC
jgi:hypothetical protein